MRQLTRCSLIALAVAGAGASQIAQAEGLEFHGYTRSQIAMSTDGGKGACYGIGGINPFRLGNECDTVIEPTFTARFSVLDDKSAWGVTVMPSVYARQGDPAGTTLDTGFGQIYVFGENVPQLANGRVWAGRRFYQRLQTGINDEFLENLDGDGAGIEDMNLGFGKLSVAWQANVYSNSATDTHNTLSGNRISARLTDIKTMPEGSLSFWANYNKDLGRDQYDAAGNTVSSFDTGSQSHIAAYHNLNGVLGGSNLIGLGYTSSEGVAANSGSDRFDFTLQQSGFISGPAIAWDAIFRYRQTSFDVGGDTSEYALGGRLDGQISGPFRWLVEAGWNQVSPDVGDSQSMWKITPALAISAGPNPWSRPTFRLYYNYTTWNDAVANPYRWSSESSANGADMTATSAGTFGIQGEAWW